MNFRYGGSLNENSVSYDLKKYRGSERRRVVRMNGRLFRFKKVTRERRKRGRRRKTRNLTRILILKSTDLSIKRIRKEEKYRRRIKILRDSILKRIERDEEQGRKIRKDDIERKDTSYI